MIVKCPIEYCSYERDTTYYPNLMLGNFAEHFESHHNEHLLSYALAKLMMKILQVMEDGRTLVVVSDVLESLLEDDDKK